jgi:hypothetical protein
MFCREDLERIIKLFSSLSENFLLLHVHGNNRSLRYFSSKKSTGNIPGTLELTYINKTLVSEYHLSDDQSYPTAIDMPDNPNRPRCRF